MSSGFKIECPDDIFEIPDVRTAVGILQKWGVSTQGIKNIQDCQDRMLQHWSSTNNNRTETFKGFRDVIIASKKNRDELVYYYGEMLNLYRTLPASQQGSLNTVFPNLEDATHQKIRELKSNECAILIAGTVASNKAAVESNQAVVASNQTAVESNQEAVENNHRQLLKATSQLLKTSRQLSKATRQLLKATSLISDYPICIDRHLYQSYADYLSYPNVQFSRKASKFKIDS